MTTHAMRGPSGRIWGAEIIRDGVAVDEVEKLRVLRELVVEGGLTLVSREDDGEPWRDAEWPAAWGQGPSTDTAHARRRAHFIESRLHRG